jgi:polyamine oxidase
MRVVVVGAGVSGLTAARDLSAGGADVIVLEARDRIGGRTWTTDVAGASIDLGGSWIHGPSGNPLADEVRSAGMTWANDGMWGMGLTVFVEGGGWAPADVVSTFVAAQADFDSAEAGAALGDDADYAAAAAWYVDDRRLAGAQALVARFGIEWLDGALNIGGLPERISASGCGVYDDHGGGNVMITGGYATLVEHLAAGLDIRTSESVTAVEHGDAGCAVVTTTERYECDRAVVTVPLTMLQNRRITFTPPITEHEEAADRLAMANLEKAVFRFDERFWSPSARRMTFVSDDHRFPTWIDTTFHSGSPTLIAFYNPLATPGMVDRPLDERAAIALDVLRTMIPEAPNPIAIHMTNWTDDPLTLGSYSYVPVGGSPHDMRRLGRAGSATLFFAGEHTVPEAFGTVHGAYISGRRAASEIFDTEHISSRTEIATGRD